MSPSLIAFTVAALLVLSVPLFLHLVIYRSTSATTLPSFLLVGPSGSGKTALLTLVWEILLETIQADSGNSLNVESMEKLVHHRLL